MKQTELIMGMPITVEIVGHQASGTLRAIFDYFRAVDRRYSTYKPHSEISRINRGLPRSRWSSEMCWVLDLCEATKQATKGYFDIKRDNVRDPSGLVKGWAIQNAANLLRLRGESNFYIEAGGDIQTGGLSGRDTPWRVGIRNPFQSDEIIKIVALSGEAIATSGTYIRGQHIYNPHQSAAPPRGVASLTVIASSIYDADRFATAAFAMGENGISFVEDTTGLEGYLVNDQGAATYTTGFERYIA